MRNLLLLFLLLAAGCAQVETQPDVVVITVIGTNDVHGELVEQSGRGGLTTFSGYVNAVRKARADDGGVLLVDAGDMWQGTLESNLNEGYSVVEAYNALGYAAAAIGNHEFDFGPLGPKSIPDGDGDDPQGALRARASKANFPLLGANLIDASTGEMVEWDNVQASAVVQRAGVLIGVIGVLTEATPATTIAANVRGLEIAPLAETIEQQAQTLRLAGASLIVVVAHAGSRCTEFDDPYDTSSCRMDGEIMRVAQALPPGLVDHIVAGHEHQGIAHDVNGIAVTAAYSNTRAFSRVDFTIDRTSGEIIDRRIFPPQPIVAGGNYEGRDVVPDEQVVAIAGLAQDMAARRRAESLGVDMEEPMLHRTRPESPLGNLFTDAMLQMNDADIAIHNVWGGIRAELPEGELTYGDVYRVFPFDNRVSIIELTGEQLRSIVAIQAHNRRRAAGFSGMRVYVSCDANDMQVSMLRPDGSEIADEDVLRVVANDFLLLGGDSILTPVTPEEGFQIPNGTPLVRETLVAWFRANPGEMDPDDFVDPDALRWNLPTDLPADCQLSGG
ncbi:MAG: 5'-nucleotidase C-terminal domain-containing protein [Woeseiaceae bacterium]|nr:5'-nucleotidase C-terminal domain-containing protein [Woeseiaceae bacterium]